VAGALSARVGLPHRSAI